MIDLNLLIGEEVRKIHVTILGETDVLPRHLANKRPGWLPKSVTTAGGIAEGQNPEGVVVLQQLPGKPGARLDGAQPGHVVPSLGKIETWRKKKKNNDFFLLSSNYTPVLQTRGKRQQLH